MGLTVKKLEETNNEKTKEKIANRHQKKLS